MERNESEHAYTQLRETTAAIVGVHLCVKPMIVLLLYALVCGGVCARFFGSMMPHTEFAQTVIERNQNPRDCSTARWTVCSHNAGIGSEVHVATACLAGAINRGLVWTWLPSQWVSDREFCSTSDTFDCVFLPVTNCSATSLKPANYVKSQPVERLWVPDALTALDFSPFPAFYWWRAQGVYYLTRYNNAMRDALAMLRAWHAAHVPSPLRCGTVCVYVRHGDKYKEMPLRPWSAFIPHIEIALENSSQSCATPHAERDVFLLTDDNSVVFDARRTYGRRLLVIEASILPHLPHEAGGENTSRVLTSNLLMSFLNLDVCLEADAFVSQRQANFARLIDELRKTRARKLHQLYLDVDNAHDFAW